MNIEAISKAYRGCARRYNLYFGSLREPGWRAPGPAAGANGFSRARRWSRWMPRT